MLSTDQKEKCYVFPGFTAKSISRPLFQFSIACLFATTMQTVQPCRLIHNIPELAVLIWWLCISLSAPAGGADTLLSYLMLLLSLRKPCSGEQGKDLFWAAALSLTPNPKHTSRIELPLFKNPVFKCFHLELPIHILWCLFFAPFQALSFPKWQGFTPLLQHSTHFLLCRF